ncbi:sugar transferase [Leuconostoc carnosum]|uniref:sugar transferase n=1 Tax=Leuconostoc carnosum TaxID=1252 RepID=UPI001239A6B8|nr:sugar transferase [Leuconostoc carnosum]KAA8375845.1 sugar transferase [Leuconostoc carnosum]KAA8378509.1 sugar transferase [Leuconostoc carnosum]
MIQKNNTMSKKVELEKVIVSQNKFYLFTKRVIDCVGSIIGMIIFLPLALVIALTIKFEDGGSIIFKQKRVGYNGSFFYIYKFRSMCDDAELLKLEMLAKNDVEGAMFKIKDDPRITRCGKFIRRHSLDELPQLLNVLKGDMSLVGPRPPLVDEVVEYTSYEKQRLLVRPGLSGLWQISGRNNLSFSEMVELDLKYIQTRNTYIDIVIILKTIISMISIKKNGAF